jgi:putative membrane protein
MRFVQGFFMAAADSVPGVSGGTIAFLLGFYDEFINALDDLFKGKLSEKKKALLFLIKIGIGWVAGFVICALLLVKLFDKKIYGLSSLFLGFIIFAIPLVIIEEKEVLKGKYKNIIFSILGMALVVGISLLNTKSGLVDVGNITHLTIPLAIYIFLTGAIAITAMVLPGISGSTLLLLFGLYMPIMTCVKKVLSFNFNYLLPLLIFMCGLVVGIVTFVRLIKKSLVKYRSQTIYTIIGMMLGSLYAIVQGPTTLKVPQPAMTFSTFSILWFIVGVAIIFLLQVFKKVMEK